MTPMFEHNGIAKYDFNNIPIGKECSLMSETYMQEFSDEVIKMLNEQECSPYEVGFISRVVVKQINENSLDLSWYANTHTRFHEISISIPRDKVKISVDCWQYDIKPYIFVDHEWLEQLHIREYSVFALIDAIGVKNAIRDSLLTKEKLITLRDKIDALSSKHQDISFISFADSLILKSNWSVGYFRKGIKCSYEPEKFLMVFKEIQKIYSDVLDLNVYAVLTQGSNEYYEEQLLHISETKNHVCLNSLGVPFAELLAIEKSAKGALHNGTHPPAELYIDEQFFHSLNLDYKFKASLKSKNTYNAIMKREESFYFYSSCDEIITNLKE